MALKLAVLLAVVALAGQGLAWPRSNVYEVSQDEMIPALPKSVLTDFLGHTQYALTDGIKKCFSTSVEIVKESSNQVALYMRAGWTKFSLFGKVLGCFFKREVTTVHECGLAAFSQYKEAAKKIEEERVASRQRLSELLQILPKCLKDEPAPTTTPPTEPTTVPTTQPTTKPTTQPTTVPTTKPTTQPTTVPTTKPTTQPTTVPTTQPTTEPTTRPTTRPTTVPTTRPTTRPTTEPTTRPTTQPTRPTTQPTTRPTTQPPTEATSRRHHRTTERQETEENNWGDY